MKLPKEIHEFSFAFLYLSMISIILFIDKPVSARSLSKRASFYIANETVCVVDDVIYHNTDPIPSDDPCETCKCRPPGFACVLRKCEIKPGCKAVRKEGECCPQYVCGCEHNGVVYKDGDVIRNTESPCYTCYCQGSSIACALVDCYFRHDCAPKYVPGECCPRYDDCSRENTSRPITVNESLSTIRPPITYTYSPRIASSQSFLSGGDKRPDQQVNFNEVHIEQAVPYADSDAVSVITSVHVEESTEIHFINENTSAKTTGSDEEVGGTESPSRTEESQLPNEVSKDETDTSSVAGDAIVTDSTTASQNEVQQIVTTKSPLIELILFFANVSTPSENESTIPSVVDESETSISTTKLPSITEPSNVIEKNLDKYLGPISSNYESIKVTTAAQTVGQLDLTTTILPVEDDLAGREDYSAIKPDSEDGNHVSTVEPSSSQTSSVESILPEEISIEASTTETDLPYKTTSSVAESVSIANEDAKSDQVTENLEISSSTTDQTAVTGIKDSTTLVPVVQKEGHLEKDESIVGEDESVLGKDESIVEKDESILGKDESIVGKDDSVVGKDESVVGKDESIVGKDESIVGKDESIVGKDDSIVGKDDSIVGKDDSIVGKDDSIEGEDESVVGKDESVVGKDESVVGKDESVVGKDESVVGKDDSLVEKDESILEKGESILEKDESILEKGESHVEKDESILEKGENITEKDESVTEKDENITEKDESVTEKDENITEKDENITEKDESVIEKDENITEKDESVTEKDESVIEKDESVTGKDESVIIEKDKSVIEKYENDEALEDKNEQISKKDEKVVKNDTNVEKDDVLENFSDLTSERQTSKLVEDTTTDLPGTTLKYGDTKLEIQTTPKELNRDSNDNDDAEISSPEGTTVADTTKSSTEDSGSDKPNVYHIVQGIASHDRFAPELRGTVGHSEKGNFGIPLGYANDFDLDIRSLMASEANALDQSSTAVDDAYESTTQPAKTEMKPVEIDHAVVEDRLEELKKESLNNTTILEEITSPLPLDMKQVIGNAGLNFASEEIELAYLSSTKDQKATSQSTLKDNQHDLKSESSKLGEDFTTDNSESESVTTDSNLSTYTESNDIVNLASTVSAPIYYGEDIKIPNLQGSGVQLDKLEYNSSETANNSTKPSQDETESEILDNNNDSKQNIGDNLKEISSIVDGSKIILSITDNVTKGQLSPNPSVTEEKPIESTRDTISKLEDSKPAGESTTSSSYISTEESTTLWQRIKSTLYDLTTVPSV